MDKQLVRVAIDARPLSHDITGIGRYTYNVLDCLIKHNNHIEWYLYSDRPLLVSFEYPNVYIRIWGNGRSFMSTLISQFVFPIWTINDKINTFWSPRHHLPLFLFFSKKIKKVVTIHDVVWKRHPNTMSKMGLILEKILFPPSIKIATSIISVSKFTTQELIELFPCTTKKTSTIQLQSFISKEESIKERVRLIEERYILFIGTLEPRKNLNNLIIAFKEITLKNQNLKLVIIGKNGWGNLKISNLVKDLDLMDKVMITGHIDNDRLVSFLKHCEVLVMPSIYEGFGLPALEALSLQKKVVVSRFNAITYFEGDNIFITELDETSIAKTISNALKVKPKNHANVGNDWNFVAEKTINLLITHNAYSVDYKN